MSGCWFTPLDVKRWHDTLFEGGRKGRGELSVASAKLAHRVLHCALADAVAVNPATGVRAPQGERKAPTVWTAAGARRFLDAMADDRLIALWTVAHQTCLRRGELAGLPLDRRQSREDGTLTVAQRRRATNRAVVITTPKTKSHRQSLLAPAPTPRRLVPRGSRAPRDHPPVL